MCTILVCTHRSRPHGQGWKGRRGRGRGRDGGPGYWREPRDMCVFCTLHVLTCAESLYFLPYRPELPPPPLIRPIFDWSEVSEHFPQAAPQLDFTFLTQVTAPQSITHYFLIMRCIVIFF